MLKALRKSTLQQRERRRQELELKVTSKKKSNSTSKRELKSKSRYLQKVIEENQVTLQRDIERLSSIPQNIEEDSTSNQSIQPVSSPSQTSSIVSLDWDEEGDLLSPLKDTSDLLDTSFKFEEQISTPPALSRSRSASVSVNRASYISLSSENLLQSGTLLDLQPVCSIQNLDLQSSSLGNTGLISQDSFLERNFKAKEIETLQLIEECERFETTCSMEETIFQAKVKALKAKYRRVLDKIDEYNADDVSVVDVEQYKVELERIRNSYETFIEEVHGVLDLLGEEETERISVIQKFKTDAKQLFKQNEKEVKAKVASLLPASAVSGVIARSDDSIKVEKLKKRIARLIEKADEGTAMALDINVSSKSTDNEVREYMHKSKKLEIHKEEILKCRDKIDEDSVGLDIDPEDIESMKTSVKSAVDSLTNVLKNLELEDKSRGLYSLTNKNLARENVAFPEAFTGELGENVYQFKDKFLQAIQDSQVRDKDKVDVLRKHLT